jgi:DNA invertase Pin-like site-specific DNA recombinase
MARKSRKNLDFTDVSSVVKPVYNAGGYVRISVVDVRQKGDSIETQQSIINSFIAEHPDIELREVYIDNGLSGQTFERPAFKRMIADMENGRINCCIVKDLSRLGRNAIDSGYYIEKYFPAHKIRFVAITDDYDSADSNSGGVMINLKNMVNEAYALEVGRKIRATHQMNIKSGRFVGSAPPYGYLKSRDDCHKLIPDEYAAHIVRHIFEMTADGKSVKDILKWLTANEILTPSRYLHSIGVLNESKVSPHSHWSYQRVSEILCNRVYCGDMVQGKTKIVHQTSKKIPKSEWIIVENTHEAVISRELFEKVQNIRGATSGVKESVYTTPAKENLFSGRIFCGHCGFSMVRRRYNESTYGYVCHTVTVKSK